MSVVSLVNVEVLDNPAPFDSPYKFEITIECLEQLQKDLEWKLTYVGSASSCEHDQLLDELQVGPVPVGVNKFTFEASPPEPSRIPNDEILGITVILLSCSYRDREFVRVGYYVNNEYNDEKLQAEPPLKPEISKIYRNIREKPRVTKFSIKWDSEESAPAEFPPDQPEADLSGDVISADDEEELEDGATTDDALGAESGKDDDDDDAEMAGVEGPARLSKGATDVASDAGSEDLEAESSGSEDDDDIEEGEDELEGDGDADGDEEMDMGGDDGGKRPIEQVRRQQPLQTDAMLH